MSLLASVYGICNPTVKNVWNHWVDHIMKQHSRLVLNGAALIRHNGVIAASSKGFIVSAEDLNVSILFAVLIRTYTKLF